MMRAIGRVAVFALLFAFVAGVAVAEDAGLIVTDGAQSVAFDAKRIEALEQRTIKTKTAWTEDGAVQSFAGPAMADVLAGTGFSGETVLAEALDGYSVEIPRARLSEDGAVLAIEMNGAPLPEDKAPYWIVFPYDQSPEMNDEDHQSWSVWAVTKLTVK